MVTLKCDGDFFCCLHAKSGNFPIKIKLLYQYADELVTLYKFFTTMSEY